MQRLPEKRSSCFVKKELSTWTEANLVETKNE